LRKYADEVTDILAMSVPTPFGFNDDGYDVSDETEDAAATNPSRPSTPPPKKRRSSHFVLFSPVKKNKQGAPTDESASDWEDEEDAGHN